MRLLLNVFITISVLGCQGNSTYDKLRTFNICDPLSITELKLSDLGFGEIEYIPLETRQNCLIKDITNIEFGSDHFIVQHLNNIYKFNKDGTFICSIGEVGRGPGEYLYAHEIGINKNNNQIFIADGWTRKMNVYDEGGTFVRSFESLKNSTSFILFNELILFYCTNYISNIDTSFWLLSTDGVVLKGYKNKYPWDYNVKNGTAILKENLFFNFNGRNLNKEIYSDTVYLFENENFIPDYLICSGEKLLTPAARSSFKPESLLEQYYSQERLLEFRDFIYFEFGIYKSFKYLRFSLIGSRTSKIQYIIKTEDGIKNDLDGGPSIKPIAVKDGEVLIAWIDAIELKKYIESKDFMKSKPQHAEKKKKLEMLANNLKVTDNPVLILVN